MIKNLLKCVFEKKKKKVSKILMTIARYSLKNNFIDFMSIKSIFCQIFDQFYRM